MTKRNLLKMCQAGILVSGLLFAPQVFATKGLTFMGLSYPKSTVDLGRSISGIIAGVINLCGDGESKAQLIATQETINKSADGTGDDETNVATTEAATISGTALTNGAYDYISSKLFSASNPYKYELLKKTWDQIKEKDENKNKTEYQTAELAIKEVFFTKEATNADMETVRSQRQDYAKTVTMYQMELGSQVQKKIVADLGKAASAPVSSENEVGAIAINAQTLDEMIKEELVDIGLQIELMEADAMAFMLHQRITLMDNPSEKGGN